MDWLARLHPKRRKTEFGGSATIASVRSAAQSCEYSLHDFCYPWATAVLVSHARYYIFPYTEVVRMLVKASYDLPDLQELATITDESIYSELQASDVSMGRWTDEDPSLRAVQRWLRSRRLTT